MKRFSHHRRARAIAGGSLPSRGWSGTRLGGGVIALGVLLATLVMAPAPASAAPHFVLTQNASGPISFPVPCQPGKGLDFTM